MPNNKRNRGRFSLTEQDFIKKYFTSMSPGELAKKLNRDEISIREYLEKHCGISRSNAMFAPGDDTTATIVLEELRASPEYEYLKKEFESDEVEMFEKSYASYIEQLEGDVLSTERTQIIMAVKLEVLMHRTLQEKKRNITMIKRVHAAIETLTAGGIADLDDADNVKLENFEHKLGKLEDTKDTLQKEYDQNMAKHSGIMRELKATRDQRVKNIENNKQTFIDIIKLLQEEEVKELEGRQMELLRLAGEKATKKLGQYYEYADKEIDKPILNSETVE